MDVNPASGLSIRYISVPKMVLMVRIPTKKTVILYRLAFKAFMITLLSFKNATNFNTRKTLSNLSERITSKL